MKKEQIGLWISRSILFADLTPTEKLILADILVLSEGDMQYVKTNDSITKFTNVSVRTVINSINSLKTKGLIKAIEYRPYKNVKTKRILIPCYSCIDKLLNEVKQFYCD